MVERVNEKWKRWGTELRQTRRLAGETMDSLGRKACISRQMIGKYEAGTRWPPRDKVEALDDALTTGGALRQLWEELVQDAHVPGEFKNALKMERRAREIREYHSILVPGLLQTADYARSLISARKVRSTAEEVEYMVQTRVERMAHLADTRPLLCFVVEEVAISRVVGNVQIMHEQRQRLIDLAEGGNIRLYLMSDVPRHPGLCSAFRLMNLDDSRVVAFIDDPLGGRSITKPQETAELSTIFGLVQGEALSPAESLKRIKEIDNVQRVAQE
ncbi:helix-turn-helix domain-containing protein [Streptomonospora nanhaiensis]|uniref:Transcriptional regulator with XRE-family HTH domain n=1 Tax=Streptomonospora nanhaiensis TaxID=1323731 RepID=A0A853BKT8_9ACTN|nr:helix-turn-helix transcriptional regulator [Streptomonospora nanhaiensis]MBV2366656.1 helix-turn-helix transcriptional regulator [Streptomonospora nanhaiensis]NYI95843.1 transcriptional regulator with XRE-family HTH domain [Streptomonospora nanhaiensis]